MGFYSMINALIRHQQEIFLSKNILRANSTRFSIVGLFIVIVVGCAFLLQNKCSSICDSYAQPNNGGNGDGDGGDRHHSFKSPVFDCILNIAIKVVENNAINLHCTIRNDKMLNRIGCCSSVNVCESCVCILMRAHCWKSCRHSRA